MTIPVGGDPVGQAPGATPGEAIALAPERRVALLVLVCCWAAMGEGFNLQAPGVTLPVLGPLFKLASGAGGGLLAGFLSNRSLFLSASTFGLFFGALVGGRLSDVLGRKGVAVAAVTLFAIFSALTALCSDVHSLLWARFFTGLGLGAALPNLIAIVTEAAGPQRRNTAMGLLYASMPTGGVIVSLLSYLFGNPAQWGLIYLIGGFIPLLAAPALWWLAPGRSARTGRRAQIDVGKVLFGARSGRTLTLWLAFLCALITQYVLLSWLPSLLGARGLTRADAALVQLSFNLLGAAGSVVTGVLTDRPGRSLVVALTFAAAILFLVMISHAPPVLGVALALGALVGWTVSGAQTIVYALAPAIYPPAIRGTGVGFGVAVGRIGAAVGPLIAGAVLAAGGGAAAVLSLIAVLMAVAGASAWLLSRKDASDAA